MTFVPWPGLSPSRKVNGEAFSVSSLGGLNETSPNSFSTANSSELAGKFLAADSFYFSGEVSIRCSDDLLVMKDGR